MNRIKWQRPALFVPYSGPYEGEQLVQVHGIDLDTLQTHSIFLTLEEFEVNQPELSHLEDDHMQRRSARLKQQREKMAQESPQTREPSFEPDVPAEEIHADSGESQNDEPIGNPEPGP